MEAILGRIGLPGTGRLIVSLDGEWMAMWNEAMQAFMPFPQRIQSFAGRFIGTIDAVPDAELQLQMILAAVEADPTVGPPPVPVVEVAADFLP